MRERFTRAERNLTVWQRLHAALTEAGVSAADVRPLTDALHGYVLRERHDAEEEK